MVAVWAMKEQRNLLRFAAAGIPCPLPIACKSNVLLMQFIGTATYRSSSSSSSTSNSSSSNSSSSSSG
ncbi:RIO1 family domain-containing protein, putative, partial [Eimeria tenella]